MAFSNSKWLSFTFILLFVVVLPTTFNWIQSSTSLPRPDSNMAIYHFDDLIILMGGFSYPYQWLAYNISDNTFKDRGSNVLMSKFDIYGNSQYYTQINHTFYFITTTSMIYQYDLIIDDFNDVAQIPTDKLVSSYGCLAATNDLLFVVGGIEPVQGNKGLYSNTLRIYNISSHEWTIRSNMSTARAKHSCVVDPIRNRLYVIAGTNDPNGINTLASVDRIAIDTIYSANWNFWANLRYGVIYSRAIYYADSIIVIGGAFLPLPLLETTAVQIVDCINSQKISNSVSLTYGIYGTAAIIANNKIYAFGGADSISRVDTWQYTDLHTSAPTNEPTVSPSIYPSYSPSKIPTNNPTSVFTNKPTVSPSIYLTYSPTKNPSDNPSTLPTLTPNTTPSESPTINPTQAPSTYPTIYPSESPTYPAPSKAPQIDSHENYVHTTGIQITHTSISNDKSADSNSKMLQDIMIGVTIAIIFIIVTIICYAKCKKRNDNFDKQHAQMNDHYIQLVDKEKQENYHTNEMLTPKGTMNTRTTGESVSLQSVHDKDNNDCSSQIGIENDAEDDIYNYAPATKGINEHDTHGMNTNEGDLEEGDAHTPNIDANDALPQTNGNETKK
eukprot:171427_1